MRFTSDTVVQIWLTHVWSYKLYKKLANKCTQNQCYLFLFVRCYTVSLLCHNLWFHNLHLFYNVLVPIGSTSLPLACEPDFPKKGDLFLCFAFLSHQISLQGSHELAQKFIHGYIGHQGLHKYTLSTLLFQYQTWSLQICYGSTINHHKNVCLMKAWCNHIYFQ